MFSRIANFDDLDPLIAEPDVEVTFVAPGKALPGDADLVVLPGSKATLADLASLRFEGWDVDIAAHVRRGGVVLGLCGGFQMLGTAISDPQGIEGPADRASGLGLLDVETELTGDKTLTEAAGTDLDNGAPVRGYEMHVGKTSGPGLARPMITLADRDDGAVSADGKIMGCYLHGLFASDPFRHAFLGRLRARISSGFAYEAEVERVLDDLADHLEAHLDLDSLLTVAGEIGD
jgi:adenosylcobyric acid synthase